MDYKLARQVVDAHKEEVIRKRKEKRIKKINKMVGKCYHIPSLHEYVKIVGIKNDELYYEEVKLYNFLVGISRRTAGNYLECQIMNEICDFDRTEKVPISKYNEKYDKVLRILDLQKKEKP